MTRHLSERIRHAIERHRWWVLLLFVVTLTLLLAARARAKPFWHDEVFTILESRLPLTTLWRASQDGLDLAPPLNTILTRVTHAALGAGLIRTRLPPMCGFTAACLLVFVMVRRRSNALIGLAAAIALCFTGAFQYAYEARGYDLTVGCFAVAFFAWSEAARGRRRRLHLLVMGMALAAGVWAHYYAVVAFVPLAIGELVRQIGRRRVDRASWIAFAGAAAAVLPLAPLLISSLPQAATFWTRQETVSISNTYGEVLGAIITSRFTLSGLIVMVLIVLALFRRLRGDGRRTGGALAPSSDGGPEGPPLPITRRGEALGRPISISRSGGALAPPLHGPPDGPLLPTCERHELVAGLVSLTIPALAMLVASVTGGAFVPRYTLFADVGFALVVPLAIARFASVVAAADVILCLILVVPLASDVVNTLASRPFESHNPIDDRPLLTQQLARGGDIVVSGGLTYLQLWYYLSAEQQPRAIYVADPETELRETHTDTIDRGYLSLSRWSDVPIVAYNEFVLAQRTFYVYGCGPHWLSNRLHDDGASISNIRYELGCWLYRVDLPPVSNTRGQSSRIASPSQFQDLSQNREAVTPDLYL